MSEVLIIGGGIGGLTLGIALQQRGIDAHVFEAAPELRAAGAGITVPPNAMRILARLALADEVAEAGIALDHMEIRDVGGIVLQVIDGRAIVERHGYPLLGIRRSELQRILAGALRDGTLHLSKRLESFEERGDRLHVAFEDGSAAEGALMIGADGLRSTVRGALRPDVRLRYSGQTCWRGLASVRLPDELHRTAWELWGGASRFGFLEVGPDSVYWFAPAEAPAGTEAASISSLQERYRLFPRVVQEIIGATPAGALIQTDLFDIPPMRGWSAGRVVLLGDAAHATTPNLGQGGAQAMEDALSLALKLEAAGLDPRALREYERARAARTRKIVNLSWRLGRAAHWKHPLARRLRNAIMRAVPARVQQRQTDDLLTPVL